MAKKPTKAQVISAIKGSGGIVSSIAKKLNIDWHTAKGYTSKWPEAQLAYDAENESILDLADAKLYENIKNNDMGAIKWLQSTKGKNRGYIPQTDVNLSGEVTHKVKRIGFKGQEDDEDQ